MSNETIPRFQLPHPVDNFGKQEALAVVFLCPLQDDTIADVCKRICHADGALPVVPVPWILDTTPPLSIIHDIGLQFHVFIDQDSLSDGTAIVANEATTEFARVSLEMVNAVASSCQNQSATSLSDLVAPSAMIRIEREEKTTQHDDLEYEMVVPPLDHIPDGVLLEPSKLTLIALAHIPREELERLKSRIGTEGTVTDVVVHNWPAEAREPATRADLYRTFQAVGPIAHDDLDESFLFFIEPDADSLPGYRILQASMRWGEDGRDGGEFARNSIRIASLKDMGRVQRLWDIAWNPFTTTTVRHGPTVDGARVNPRLDRLVYSQERGDTYGNYFDIIPNPDRPLLLPSDGRGPTIFVLSDMNDSDARLVREHVSSDSFGEPVFCNVSHLVTSPDAEGLVHLFQSPEFLATGQEPPTTCFAVDQTTLGIIAKGLMTGDDEPGAAEEDDIVIILCQDPMKLEVMDDNGGLYSEQCMGYAFSRLGVDEAGSAWANLETGNMFFHELVRGYDCVCWNSTRAWLDAHPDIDDREDDEPLACKGAFYPGVENIVEGPDY